MTARLRQTSTARRMGIAITVVCLALAAFAVWRQASVETFVLGYGSVSAQSRFGNSGVVTFRTRRVRAGDIFREEVELSAETWVDCAGDCAETVRKQKLDFWETRRRREH